MSIATAADPAAALSMIRDGLATLHRAYEAYPSDVTAGLIREYEAALRELVRRTTPPAPVKPPAHAWGGRHAKPTTDNDVSWTPVGSRALPPFARRWPDAPRAAADGI